MSESNLSRRSFLRLLAVAPIVPYLPVDKPNIIAETDFGFTWGAIKAPEGFGNVIKTTLKSRTKEIAENLTKSNTLLLKLKDNDYVKVNKITPEEQTKRILDAAAERVKARDEKHKNQAAFQEWRRKPAKENIYYE